MFNESESKEITSLIKGHLGINGVGQAAKREEIAAQLTEIVRNYLVGRYSTDKKPPKQIGVHGVKPLPEDFPK